jgi:murein L,D-transpeptidase YafK
MVQLSFKESQLKHSRVKVAYEEKEHPLKQLLQEKTLLFNDLEMFIRAFKKEQQLEVWGKRKDATRFNLIVTYNFCSSSGTLGPKRKEGDLQIPEGVYYINHFNPQSNFHLSLGINYPNKSDKILGDKLQPGSAIYIHGNCVTVGCIPITDDKIKELYLLAVEAKNAGQEKIPVHIFPTRLNQKNFQLLTNEPSKSDLIAFWSDLQKIYADFENNKSLKPIHVNSHGKYRIDP